MNADSQRGIALITVLWLLLLLSVIAAGTLRGARTETNLARNGAEAAAARALAEAGVARALLALSDPVIEDGWRHDGSPRSWPFAAGSVEISIQDSAGRIDLNRAPVALLAGLARAAGLEPGPATALADAIADFRDRNELRRLNGAEDGDYRTAGQPWGAKDAPFDRVAELARVLGMTPELMARLRPAVTVASGREGIDPTIAPRAALLALPGVDAQEVEAFVARRDDPGRAAGPLTTAPQAFLASGARGRVFEIRAEARSASGLVAVRTAVVRRRGGRFAIELWDDDQR